MNEAVAVAPRKIGWPLGIGILLIPLIFAWFTLRAGYSTLARVLSFGWLIVIFIAWMGTNDAPNTSATALQVPTSTKEATALPAEEDKGVEAAIIEPTQSIALRATSREIAAAYEANEVAAQSLYGDKIVAVTGVVEGVELDFMDNPVVKLEGVNPFMPLQASFGKSYARRLGNVAKGMQLTVTCKKITEVVSMPMLDDCTL